MLFEYIIGRCPRFVSLLTVEVKVGDGNSVIAVTRSSIRYRVSLSYFMINLCIAIFFS